MVLVSPYYSDLLKKPTIYINRFDDWAINSVSTEEGISHAEDLTKEALAVGLSFLPVYWITDKVLMKFFPNWLPDTRKYVNVAVAGGLFHIISEETGVNNWFLTNSVAARKAHKKHYVVSQSPAGSSIEFCDGTECGHAKMKHVAHEVFH